MVNPQEESPKKRQSANVNDRTTPSTSAKKQKTNPTEVLLLTPNEILHHQRRAVKAKLDEYLQEKGLTIVAPSYTKVIVALCDEGRHGEAMELRQKELEIQKQYFGCDVHPEMADTYHNIGRVLYRQCKYEEAMKNYQTALAISLKTVGPDHSSTGHTYHEIGCVLYKQRKYEEAMQNYQTALAINLKTFGPNHISTGNTYQGIGIVLYEQGKYEKAMENLQTALAIKLKTAGPNHSWTGNTYDAIGIVLYEQSKYEEAMENFQKALSIRLMANGPNHSSTGMAYHHMGELLQKQGRYTEANAWLEEANRVEQNEDETNGHPNNIAIIYDPIVKDLIRRGKENDAMVLLDQAIEILLTNSKDGHPDLAVMYISKADLLKAQSKNGDAAEIYDKAIAIRKQIFGAGHCFVHEVLLKKSELPPH